MSIRICPLCMGKVPAAEVAAYSDTIVCPGCAKPLEVSRPSRVLTTLAGLLAAYLVYRFTAGRITNWPGSMLGWVLPLVFGFLTWGTVTALLLMLTADLRVRTEQPSAEPISAPAAHGHAAPH